MRLVQPNLSVSENVELANPSVAVLPAYDTAISIDYTTADGAADVADYQSTAGTTLNFDAGESLVEFAIQIFQDGADESDETFAVDLSLPGGSPPDVFLDSAASSGVVTILDDDPINAPPTVQFTSSYYKVNESSTAAIISVSLSDFADDE